MGAAQDSAVNGSRGRADRSSPTCRWNRRATESTYSRLVRCPTGGAQGRTETDPVRDSHPPETSATETPRVEERRRHEELSPDIVALIASCG